MVRGSSKSSGGSGAKPPSKGNRAVDAALSSGRSFHTRTARMAERTSGRIVNRWAPEKDAVSRQRSLGSLAFADRLMAPYITHAEESASARLVHRSSDQMRPLRVSPISSWLFPIPYYQDELAWLAAARSSVATSRATADSPSRTAQSAGFAVALEYVAPSMAPSATIRPMRAATVAPILRKHAGVAVVARPIGGQ